MRWMDEDRVFATFLHELAHMEIGPHDARFYALLETLKDEAELRVASDFIVCGRCVGGGAGASRASSPNAAAAAARRRETARGSARARLRWDDVWAARRVEITIVRIRDARLRIARDAPPRDVPTTSATSSSSTDWIRARVPVVSARVFVTPNATTDAMKLARRRDKNTHDANSNASTRGDPVVRRRRRDASYSLHP